MLMGKTLFDNGRRPENTDSSESSDDSLTGFGDEYYDGAGDDVGYGTYDDGGAFGF